MEYILVRTFGYTCYQAVELKYKGAKIMVPIEAQVFVENGVNYLKEKFGEEWFQKVDLDTLNMGNGSRCIIAQVSGKSYNDYSENFPSDTILTGRKDSFAYEHGFIGYDIFADRLLKEEWSKVVKKLRGEEQW